MDLKAWHAPLRLAAGAFILNSGLTKRGPDEATVQRLHAFAPAPSRSCPVSRRGHSCGFSRQPRWPLVRHCSSRSYRLRSPGPA